MDIASVGLSGFGIVVGLIGIKFTFMVGRWVSVYAMKDVGNGGVRSSGQLIKLFIKGPNKS